MENQHRHIVGYRDLDEAEIEMLNEVKGTATIVGDLIANMTDHPNLDQRSVALARTYLQTGFMWASRAIARPESFG